MEPIPITEEIFQVGGNGLTAPEDAAIYLVKAEKRSALIDAGCGRSLKQLMENVRLCGVDPLGLDFLLLTHCHFDHSGGAKAVRDRSGCRLVVHAQDAPFLETGDDETTAASWYGEQIEPMTIDRKLVHSREEIRLGNRTLEAFHIPGHSPGSVAYAMESEGIKVLFGQDVHGPLHPSLRSNLGDYRRSLEFLISLEADILCEGHFGIFRGKGEVRRFIRSYL